MIVIGILGAKGAGKTTACNILKRFSKTSSEISLAGTLKDVCSEVFSLERDSFEDPLKKEVELNDPVYISEVELKNLYAQFYPDFQASNNYEHFTKFINHTRKHIGKVLLTPRKVLQYVGTDVLRDFDENIHCRKLSEAIENCKLNNFTTAVIVPDVRFKNEFSYLESKYEFYPIYIKNLIAEEFALKDGHASEKDFLELAKTSIKVNNNGFLQELETALLAELTKEIRGL